MAVAHLMYWYYVQIRKKWMVGFFITAYVVMFSLNTS